MAQKLRDEIRWALDAYAINTSTVQHLEKGSRLKTKRFQVPSCAAARRHDMRVSATKAVYLVEVCWRAYPLQGARPH
jgi:hypothetical protein